MLATLGLTGVAVPAGHGAVIPVEGQLYVVRLLLSHLVAPEAGDATARAQLAGLPLDQVDPSKGKLSMFLWPWLVPLPQLSALLLSDSVGGVATSPFVLGASADVPCLRGAKGVVLDSGVAEVGAAVLFASVIKHFFVMFLSLHSRGLVHGDVKASNMGMLEYIWRLWHARPRSKVFHGRVRDDTEAIAAALSRNHKEPAPVVELRVTKSSERSMPAFVTEQPFYLYDVSRARVRGPFAHHIHAVHTAGDEWRYADALSCTAGQYPSHWFRGVAYVCSNRAVSDIYLPLPAVYTPDWTWRAAVQDEWFAMEQTLMALFSGSGRLCVGRENVNKDAVTGERSGLIRAGRAYIMAVHRLSAVGDSMTFLEWILAHATEQCASPAYHEAHCITVRGLHRVLTSNAATREVWDVLNSVSLAMQRVEPTREQLQGVRRLWRSPSAMGDAVARLSVFVRKQYDAGVLPS